MRVSDDFSNGDHTIPAQMTSIQFNHAAGPGPDPSDIPMNSAPVQLSITETVLVHSSNAPLVSPPANYFTHKFDFIIEGGPQFYAPSGDYYTDLIFTLYDKNGSVIAVATIPIYFMINYYGPGNSANLTLTNNSNFVEFDFLTTDDYKFGKTIVKPEGLFITSYSDYQIIAQTVNPDFISQPDYDSFPVSLVSLSSAPSSSVMPVCRVGISCNSIKLSSSVQTLITNTFTKNWHCHNLYYDLIFSITPEDSQLLRTRSGNFSASLMLVIVPL